MSGLALGSAIGVISGVVTLLLLRIANQGTLKDWTTIVSLTGNLVGVPSSWFGGAWIADLAKLVDPKTLMPSYGLSLAVTFIIVVFYPVYRWVVQLGIELGGPRGR